MLKRIKNYFLTEAPPEFDFPSSLFIKTEEASLEDFVQQIYDTKKFRRWVSFFPFVWLRFDQDKCDEGCTGTFYFFPPFTYRFTFVEVIPNRQYKAKVWGLIEGEIAGHFTAKEDGVLYEHPFRFRAVNRLVHIYYWLFIRPPHLPFMAWRYGILKRKLIKETQRKRKEKTNEA